MCILLRFSVGGYEPGILFCRPNALTKWHKHVVTCKTSGLEYETECVVVVANGPCGGRACGYSRRGVSMIIRLTLVVRCCMVLHRMEVVDGAGEDDA
jgi:hypothetical protein